MKKFSLIATALFALSTSSVFAAGNQNTSIDFTGTIAGEACKVQLGGSATGNSLPLGQVATSTVGGGKEKGAPVALILQFTDCAAGSGATNVDVEYISTSDAASIGKILNGKVNGSDNGGAYVQLLDLAKADLKSNKFAQVKAVQGTNPSAGSGGINAKEAHFGFAQLVGGTIEGQFTATGSFGVKWD